MRPAFTDCAWATQMDGESLQFSVDVGELRLVGIDTSVPGKPYGRLEDDQLDWLEGVLAEAPSRPTILALHHPPIATGIAHMDRSGLREPGRLKEIVAQSEAIVRVVCGHQHRMITSQFGGAILNVAPGVAHQVVFDLTEDAPSAFTFEPPAALLHQWSGGNLVSHMAYIEKFPGPYPFWPGY